MAKLGDVVSDKFTAYHGVVVGRAEFLYGCVRVQVQSKELKDGRPIEADWFDEDRFVVDVEAATPKPASAELRRGGPIGNPTRSGDARR